MKKCPSLILALLLSAVLLCACGTGETPPDAVPTLSPTEPTAAAASVPAGDASALKKTAARAFDTLGRSYRMANCDGFYYTCRAATLCAAAPDTVSVEWRGGVRSGEFALCTLQSGLWQPVSLPIAEEPRETEAAPCQTNCGGVWATLRSDNSVSISFETAAQIPDCLAGLDLSRSYEVAGCYQRYTGLYLGICGQGDCPVLFLLTADGGVEAVELAHGLAAGCPCSTGPLPLLPDITALSDGTAADSGTQTVFAVDADGGRYDLRDIVSAVRGAMLQPLPDSFLLECEAVGGGAMQCLGDMEAATGALTLTLPETQRTYTGTLTPLGMGDAGLLYRYDLTDGDGAAYCGCVGLCPVKDAAETYRLTCCSGDGLPEIDRTQPCFCYCAYG